MPRKSLYPISNIFINRWSSRAFSDEKVTKEELMVLFEAARWAPSSYNEQPWRFIYTNKGSNLWDELLTSMIPFNQSWAKNAPVFVVIVSKKNFDRNGELSHLHSFDAGAAWMCLALQGSLIGLVIHAIGGFDYDKVKTSLNISPEFKIEIIVAIGKQGKKEILPPELQAREQPNDRKQFREIVFEDSFQK